MERKIGQKPPFTRWGQSLWVHLRRWSDTTGLPLDRAVRRLQLLLLAPFYVLRLGPVQGLTAWYRFLAGEGGFTVYRSERDQGVAIREDSTDAWVFQQIFIQEAYRSLGGRQDIQIIIDAGAYVGYSALYLADQYPHAFIYALEPEESNFQALQRNTRHYPNIKAIQAALWKEDGYLEVKEGTDGQWSHGVQESVIPSVRRIPAITLETLIQQYRLPRIDILKMDVEGSEAAIFEGHACHRWLEKVRILSIGLHGHLLPGSDRSFLAAMNLYNCSVVYAGDNMIIDFEVTELRNPAKITA